MALTLIRHTRPAGAAGLCYGRRDLPCADSFAADAVALRPALPDADAILTSPLRRCRCLADWLGNALGLAVEADARLAEMDFGRWEGRPWAAIPRAEIDAWAADVWHARPHGGENPAMLAARSGAALAAAARDGRRWLVVTHAGVIRVALAPPGGAPFSGRIDHGAVLSLLP